MSLLTVMQLKAYHSVEGSDSAVEGTLNLVLLGALPLDFC